MAFIAMPSGQSVVDPFTVPLGLDQLAGATELVSPKLALLFIWDSLTDD